MKKLLLIIFGLLPLATYSSDWTVGFATSYGGTVHYKLLENAEFGFNYDSSLSEYGYSNLWGVSGAWKPFSKLSEHGFIFDFYYQSGVRTRNEVVFNNYSSKSYGVSFGFQLIFPEITWGLFSRIGFQISSEDLIRLDTGAAQRRGGLGVFAMVGYNFL